MKPTGAVAELTESRPAADEFRPIRARMGLETLDAAGLADEVLSGFDFACFEAFVEESGLSQQRSAELVRISPTTLARRKAEGRLDPDESERLLRIAGLFDAAFDLFEGDRDAAGNWLQSPQAGLCGRVPVEFAATEVGAREVERLIHRLEHGVVV